MKAIQLESLSKETLIKLIQMYSRNWNTLDGLWFRNVEDEFGTEVAIRLDAKMWLKQAEIEAKRIKEVLNITQGGIEALLKVSDFLTGMVGGRFQINFEEVAPERVIIYFSSCINQEARLKQGLKEFPCKQAGISRWVGMIKVVDPRIKVDCLFCPPDPHPEGIWCKWKFTLTK